MVTNGDKVVAASINARQYNQCIKINANKCKVKTQRKVCGFDENDMKTYSCRQGRIRFYRNDIVFNENVTIVLHVHIVFVSFSCCSFGDRFQMLLFSVVFV